MNYYRGSDEHKLLEEKYKYKYTCKCGHKVYIYPCAKKTKKICDWCGNYVYTSIEEEKKDIFKSKLKRVMKELS